MKRKIKRFLNKLFNIKKPYYSQGFLYIDSKGKPVSNEITDTVRWLDKLTIYHWSSDDAEKEAFKQLKEKYPEYKGKIWLF